MKCPRCSSRSYVTFYSEIELKCLACGFEKTIIPLDVLGEVEAMVKDPKKQPYIKKGYAPHVATQSKK